MGQLRWRNSTNITTLNIFKKHIYNLNLYKYLSKDVCIIMSFLRKLL